MTPEQKSSFIGWVSIALAILWMIPNVPSIAYVLSRSAQQFWQEAQRK
ncbi:hypothetical protein H6F51_21480 [Cyanobacteria bacterium FACHB-DQ100]|nr:hypothetical protein [Cyanobacteria bacterium FACHB-DQ100]